MVETMTPSADRQDIGRSIANSSSCGIATTPRFCRGARRDKRARASRRQNTSSRCSPSAAQRGCKVDELAEQRPHMRRLAPSPPAAKSANPRGKPVELAFSIAREGDCKRRIELARFGSVVRTAALPFALDHRDRGRDEDGIEPREIRRRQDVGRQDPCRGPAPARVAAQAEGRFSTQQRRSHAPPRRRKSSCAATRSNTSRGFKDAARKKSFFARISSVASSRISRPPEVERFALACSE